jgi:hypothetical protein
MPSERGVQMRVVKFLAMFVQTLLIKGPLLVQELKLDLYEICVRYI